MRGLRFVGYGILAFLGAVLLLAVGERALGGGEVLNGVRLAGVPVAGRDVDDARAAVARRARDLEENRFVARSGESEFTFTAGDVGLVVDARAAAAAVERAGRGGNPVAQLAGAVLRRFRPDEVNLGVTYDGARLERTVERWREAIDGRAKDGGIRIEGGAVVEIPALDGRRLDRGATAELIRRALAGTTQSPLTLPVTRTPPALGADEVARVAGEARRVLAGPTTVVVEGRPATLSAGRLGQLLEVTADGKRLRLDLPAKALHDALRPQLAGLEIPARDARFVIEQPAPAAPASPVPATPVPAALAPGGPSPAAPAPPAPPAPAAAGVAAPVVAAVPAPLPPPAPPAPPPPPVVRIEESATGRELDAAPVAEAILLGEHQVDGRLRDLAPRIDTERAQALRIVEPVSTFTTKHPAGQPRVRNIHRIADMLQGTVILPGDRFSMNDKVGRRTKANGFVKAPVIYEGEFTEDIGGGVSQFATTFFNAAFFGGYELVAHKAHTFYISRYPMGREATVSFPEPDLVIRNDSTSGILVQTSYTASSITVTFWGDKEGKTVRAEGPRVGKRTGRGFSVGVTRVIERPGAEPLRQEIRTYYRTQPKAAPRAPRPPAAPTPAPAPAPPPTPAFFPPG